MKTINHKTTANGSVSSIVSDKPSDRKAKCDMCGAESHYHKDLPFVRLEKGKSHYTYYCGCRGWD